ncbi:MAG: hypothetical protein M0Q53_20255 [Prolixibacteraceae bacterium]|nr:hypothetical protein [Prolixibacteraceae bacterium]
MYLNTIKCLLLITVAGFHFSAFTADQNRSKKTFVIERIAPVKIIKTVGSAIRLNPGINKLEITLKTH